MSITSRSSRPARLRNARAVGILFAVAGVFQVLAVGFGWLPSHPGTAPLYSISNIAFAIAFIALGVWKSGDSLARAAFWVAGIGWAILAITTVVPIGSLGTIGLLVAAAGCLGSGIAVFMQKLLSPTARTFFVIGMLLGTLNLLNAIAGFLGAVGAVVTLCFGAAVLVAGVLHSQRK